MDLNKVVYYKKVFQKTSEFAADRAIIDRLNIDFDFDSDYYTAS